jgi:hypothetical protein
VSRCVALILAIFAACSSGRGLAAQFVPRLPPDMDQVDVYLLTAGRGDQIYALFGHTILRIVDRKSHTDMSFNWGAFDFRDPDFAVKFYLGDLNYFVDIQDFRSLIEDYGRYDHRRLVQEKFNLTAAQKDKLLRKVIWSMQPENLHYQYKQTRDNCSTKPRDALDEALGGAIRDIYAHRLGREPFRPYIRDGARQFWWADIGMDMLINAKYDEPISQWDEMFLPAKLREHLLSMPAYDDAGKPVPGVNLLSGTDVIVDLPEPFAQRDAYFALGLIMVVPSVLLWFGKAPFPAMSSNLWVRLVGLAVALFGLWSGLFGLSMTTNWLISRYAETWANANLWLMWPVDLVFCVWGLRALFTGRPFAEASFFTRSTRVLSRLHIAGFLVLALLAAFAVVRQNVTPVLATTGAAGLLLYGLCARRVA